MEAMYTYHPSTPDRKDDYMVIASKAEWQEIQAVIMNYAPEWDGAAGELIKALQDWGINW